MNLITLVPEVFLDFFLNERAAREPQHSENTSRFTTRTRTFSPPRKKKKKIKKNLWDQSRVKFALKLNIWVLQLTFKKATQNEQLTATPPYGHLVITATLFWPEQKLSQSLCLVKEPFEYGHPANTDSFLWFVGVQINEIPLCFLSLITISLK